jgi:hypothetical protein
MMAEIQAIRVTILRLAVLFAMALTLAQPAFAEVDNLSFAISYNKNAKSFADTALSFYNSGNYVEACKTYGQALESAGKALSYEQAYQAQLDRTGNLDLHAMDEWSNSVYRNKTIACEKANAPPPFDHVAALADLQSTLNALDTTSSMVMDAYKSGATASACTAAKAIVPIYERTSVKAHTYLEKTTQPEAQKARINILQIDWNARRAAKDRDEFYCLPTVADGTPPSAPVAKTNSPPEFIAFITLANEMQLENGLPTKLGSARAHALFNQCYSNNVQGLELGGSYWGKMISWGCLAMIEPFDKTGRVGSCTYIQEGMKLVTSYGGAPYSAQDTAQFVQLYSKLNTAFKCPALAITTSASGIMAIDGVDYIIVKSYPMRPAAAEKPVVITAAPIKEAVVKNEKPVAKKKVAAKKK